MADNQFSGPLQDRFDEINESDEKGLNNLIAMDLQNNLFTGAIPPSLAGLGAIRVIKLQYNQFTGSVPEGLCDIRGPQTLTLLEADCGGDVPNECSCCSSCCDRDTNTCEFLDERRLVNFKKGKIDDLAPKRNALNFHERVIPRKRTLQSSASDCTARYRWDSDTGILVQVVDEDAEE